MINHTFEQGTATVTITGRFDFRSIKDFQHAVKSREASMWVVDLQQVNYVDSSALGMLLLLRDRVQGDSKRVQLRGLNGQPRDVLLMAKFDRMFTLV